MAYPAEPWYLEGQLYLSVWFVRRADCPCGLPPGTRPLAVAGRCVMGTAWVVYEDGGVLRYNELVSAVLVRRGAMPMPCVTDAWVDSPASLEGGRRLWGIPKERADFTFGPAPAFRAWAEDARGEVAAAEFRRGLTLPGRWTVAARLAQTLDGVLTTVPVRARGRIQRCASRWEIPADGALGRLAGHRPVLSLALRDVRIRFGAAPPAM